MRVALFQPASTAKPRDGPAPRGLPGRGRGRDRAVRLPARRPPSPRSARWIIGPAQVVRHQGFARFLADARRRASPFGPIEHDRKGSPPSARLPGGRHPSVRPRERRRAGGGSRQSRPPRGRIPLGPGVRSLNVGDRGGHRAWRGAAADRRPARPWRTPPSGTDRQARARAWFEALRDRICAAFEAIEDAAAGRAAGPPPGPLRAPAMGTAGRRRRRDGRAARPGVREGRRQRLHRPGRALARVPRRRSRAEAEPRFWASGIWLVAHMRSRRACRPCT